MSCGFHFRKTAPFLLHTFQTVRLLNCFSFIVAVGSVAESLSKTMDHSLLLFILQRYESAGDDTTLKLCNIDIDMKLKRTHQSDIKVLW